jgi:hypothetical protein
VWAKSRRVKKSGRCRNCTWLTILVTEQDPSINCHFPLLFSPFFMNGNNSCYNTYGIWCIVVFFNTNFTKNPSSSQLFRLKKSRIGSHFSNCQCLPHKLRIFLNFPFVFYFSHIRYYSFCFLILHIFRQHIASLLSGIWTRNSRLEGKGVTKTPAR